MAEQFIKAEVTGPNWLNKSGLQQTVSNEYYKALKEGLKYSRRIMQKEIEASGAVASKTLFNSVAEKVNNLSLTGGFYSGEVYFKGQANSYATNADKGRRPGRVPPSERILSWMTIKGIDPKFLWPIMITLAKEGTGTRFWNLWGRTSFVDSAVEKIDAYMKEKFEKTSEEIVRKLNNATTSTISTKD